MPVGLEQVLGGHDGTPPSNHSELSAALAAGKSALLEGWVRAVEEDRGPDDDRGPLVRTLEPLLGALVDRLAIALAGSPPISSGRFPRRTLPEIAVLPVSETCALDEALRGLSLFRAVLWQHLSDGHRHPTAAETRLLVTMTDELAAIVVSEFCNAETERFAAMRSRLVAMLGHDLRNPLNLITISATALLRRHPPERDEIHLRHIVSGAERMARMIGDILDLASAQHSSPNVALARELGALAAIAKEAVEEARVTHPRRAIVFEARGDGKGRWDRHRLLRVASNLLANALAYSPPESEVQVAIEEREDRVVLAVHNFGAAIDPATQRAIFEPFTRGPATPGKTGGLGLGLFIAREIARAHGGDIRVESSPEAGTTFLVELPLARAAERPRALIIDDDCAIAEATKALLDALGFDAAVCHSGDEAWERVRGGERFAVVVSDLDMPGMDGLAFREAARCLWPEIDEKLIFVTGSDELERIGATGAHAFQKPVGADFCAYLGTLLGESVPAETSPQAGAPRWLE
jgi:signal transduction histidine kinase/CheY-like chemotaxis protein